MASLARRDDLFDDLFTFRRDFDGIFNRFLKNGASAEMQAPMPIFAPPIEARVDPNDKTYHLSVALPGVAPDEIQLTLQSNALTIGGEHKAAEEKKDSNYLHKEFSLERFARVVLLPEDIDYDRITAQYENGVLEIVAPISPAALPKRIEVKSLPKAKATNV